MPARGTDRKPRLSVERIIDVAMKQLREKGYDAVTMRSIAAELGTGQASLYAHVANRNQLDGLVMARISLMLDVPDPDPDRWDDQLRDVALEMLRLYREHPGTARCTMGNMPESLDALRPVERLLAIVRSAGVADTDAGWFGDQMALYIAAFAMEEDIWRSRATSVNLTEEEAFDHIPEVFASLPEDEFPVLISMQDALMAGDGDDRFGFGIDLLIQGLKARQR